MKSIDKGANIRFEINSAVLCSKYFNFRNDFWHVGPIRAPHEFILRAVVGNKPDFSMMGRLISIFPTFDNKRFNFECNQVDLASYSVNYKLIDDNKSICLLNCLNNSNDNSGSVPINNSTHELFRLLEVLNGIKGGKRISDDKVGLTSSLFGLLAKWPNRQRKCYARCDCCDPTAKGAEPVAQAIEATFIIAKAISSEYEPGAVEQKDCSNYACGDQHPIQEITRELPHTFKPRIAPSSERRTCAPNKSNKFWRAA